MKAVRFLFATACGASMLSPLFATSATGIGSFEGEEEPTVRYIVSSDSFATGDTYDNLTNATNGLRATLRYRVGDWWDGDRATTSEDRQRAEVKGLGVHQKNNETFEYQSTWRTNSTYVQAGHFCHIFQLKATDGDNGAPLVTQSTDNGGTNAAIQHWSGTATGFTNARTFTYTPNQNKTVNIRIKVATTNTGELRASINGDAMQGQTNISLYRPDATDYRPKWGLYRGVDSNDPIGDDYIEHTNVTANKVTGGTTPQTYNFEAETASPTGSGATVSTTNDTAASGGVLQFLNSDGTGDYIQMTTPSIQAGTYSIRLVYKSNNSRGQHTVTIDGTQVGGTVDQYASTQSYVTVTLGNIALGAGTHTIRLTVNGKNASSSNYILSADKFTFVGQ